MNELRPCIRQSFEFTASIATVAIAFTIVGLAIAGYWRSGSPADTGPVSALRAIEGAEVSIGRLIKQNDAAKVVIVEFSDFQCRFCRMYSRDLFPAIWKELVESGKADYAFRHFPLDAIHPHAMAASDAAECSGDQGRFWEMHDALFAPTLSRETVMKEAGRLALDLQAFERCLAGDVRSRVLADLEEGKRLGIVGTPTFLVGIKQAGGRMKVVQALEGAQGVSAFTAAVSAAVAKAS